MNALEIENLSVSFDKEVVIKELSFILERGEKLVISGESGSGKSTLLNVLLGFVIPQHGIIRVFDEPLNEENIVSIRSKMSLVPQELHFPVETARELMLLPFKYHINQAQTPSEEEVTRTLEQVGLKKHVLDKSVSEISGGQKQRIIIASCYLLKKPLVIMDEPTSALDQNSKQKVMDLLFNNPELTLVAATHDAEWIEAADKKLFLP